MTIREFVKDKYKAWRVTFSEADLILPNTCICPEDKITAHNIRDVERALLGKIPELLLMPTSVSELGVSISRANREAIMAYYRYKCQELGVKDMLSEENQVRFL